MLHISLFVQIVIAISEQKGMRDVMNSPSWNWCGGIYITKLKKMNWAYIKTHSSHYRLCDDNDDITYII